MPMKLVKPSHSLTGAERAHCDTIMRKFRALYRAGQMTKKEFDAAVGVAGSCSTRWFGVGDLPGSNYYPKVVAFAQQRFGEDYPPLPNKS